SVRATGDRADGDTDRGVAPGELVGDVVRQHWREHRQREEIAKTARDDQEEPRGEELVLLAYEFASFNASSHDARSAISLRYCMTLRGRLKPSAPLILPSLPNSATNCRSSIVPWAMCTSASADTTPTVWIFRSYWSDHTNGTGANAD